MKELQEGLRMPYRDFWVAYLDAHRKPATRGMHYLATLTGIGGAVLAVWLEFLWFMAGGIALGVVIAVSSHHLIEHNQPLIRVNPFYGAVSDLRMCWLALTGGLTAEYARLGLGRPGPKERVATVPARDTAARPA
ncbi:DUF962 domain-containing protein [Dongia deserti]|uniref:DUF962 domain-containing protein n=1 Tax=Dongia deserti TaxID=2268030 RepID=UPI000E653557|nr:DUF962 domain-containing protein [Dongia deserti]